MLLHPRLMPFLVILLASCTDSSSSGPRGSANSVVGDSVNVVGTLILSADAAAETTASVPTATQPVQLSDESGTKVAEGITDTAGNFSLQIDGNALGLADTTRTVNPFEVPRVLKLSSLFLINSQDKDKAVGIQQSMVLDSKRFSLGADGKPEMETGVQQARKVGAIIGQVKLETGGDFVGTDVYIPGTSYIAKTDSEGRFLLGFLPAGVYDLRAERDGYVSSEWSNIVVIKNETTLLENVTLPIAVGPQIQAFTVSSISESSGEATIKVKLHAATKYRISKRSDFSDTQFKPVDAAKPEFELKFEVSAGFKVVQIFLEAADSDGLSANSVLTIDRDPPRLGSISVNASNQTVNNANVPLILSAEGADKMRFSETYDGLANATWTNYATSFNYPLLDTADGAKRIYVTFADNSGNLLGGAGELSTIFTLDRTAPADNKIVMLQPESPTGAFNTPLAWTADYTDANISYQIQVSAQNSFGTILRDMTTTQKTLNINPPLETAGTYHWRVRAMDQAGNRSSWVESTTLNSTSFSVQILAEAYHAKFDAKGQPGRDHMFAKELVAVGDVNNDNVIDYAYSIMQTTANSGGLSCQDCGAVQVLSGTDWSVLGTVTDGLDKSSGFGHRVITCDVDGDGRDEMVVSAPGHAVEYNNTKYYNAGAFYVYRLNDFTRVDRVIDNPVVSGYVPGYYSCSQWDYMGCKAYGWQYYPSAIEYIPWGEGRYLGWDMACMRKSGAQNLLVGEPRYHDGTGSYGRIQEYSYSSGAMIAVNSLVGSTSDAMFGAAVKHLKKFTYGSCSVQTETIAVGLPRKQDGSYIEKGSVSLYQKSGGVWTSCETIGPITNEYANAYWGSRLFNLGDIDKDTDQTEELAIATNNWNSGTVRIYGGSGGTLLKSYVDSSSGFGRLGYQVAAAGDYTGDGQSELAITAPETALNGQWGAGTTMIFRWADLDANDNNANPAPLLTVTGIPSSSANLGAGFVPILATAGDIHSASSSFLLAAPGRNVSGDWGVGSFHKFSKLKLAPGLPTRITGESTNARMGASLAAVGDIDSDNVPDFIIGQPGGRCSGKPYGMISLFSVLDNRITSNVCALYSGDQLGNAVTFLPEAGQIAFTKRGYGYLMSRYDFFYPAAQDLNSTYYSSNNRTLGTISWSFVGLTSSYRVDANTNEILTVDPSSTGRVQVTALPNNTNKCIYQSADNNTLFGYWASFIADLDADGVRDILIGEPQRDVGGGHKGRLYIIKGGYDSSNDGPDCTNGTNFTITDTSPQVLTVIDVDDAMIQTALSKEGENGFGSFVLGLPDLDGSGPNKAYFMVSNTNMVQASSSATPQYFIFGYDGTSLSLVKNETGDVGAMLGGYAKVIDDVNGDGIAELAMSYPGGSGRLGKTGHVRILSGTGLATPSDANDDLMQMLFNPDPTASNFGISFEYADITGDGLKDFIVGADQYDSYAFQNAGALYVFAIAPIQ